jgi:hypothetical protein
MTKADEGAEELLEGVVYDTIWYEQVSIATI